MHSRLGNAVRFHVDPRHKPETSKLYSTPLEIKLHYSQAWLYVHLSILLSVTMYGVIKCLSISRAIGFFRLFLFSFCLEASEVTSVGAKERIPLFFLSLEPRSCASHNIWCYITNKDVKSVLDGVKLRSGEVWCQWGKVIVVETSSECAGKYSTTDCPEEKKKLWFVVFANFHGVNTPICPISYPYQATKQFSEVNVELEKDAHC